MNVSKVLRDVLVCELQKQNNFLRKNHSNNTYGMKVRVIEHVTDPSGNIQEENLERRDELVKVLEIDLNWRMNKVSDGQRKRVQIMLGLLKPFKFLIIDEFTNELDVVIRDNFFIYLKKECLERNCSIIYATHIFDNLENFATDVVFISNGVTENIKSLKDFNNTGSLFHSVKNKILENKNIKKDNTIDKTLFGPQGGWSSGRGNLIN